MPASDTLPPGKLVIDIDGTLCPIKAHGESYADLVPYQAIIDKMRDYQARGFTILLHTSRNMRTYDGDLGLINRHTAPVLFAWLEKWQIPYDEILFGKPWAGRQGFYVDDRTIRPKEFLSLDEAQIEALLRSDRVE